MRRTWAFALVCTAAVLAGLYLLFRPPPGPALPAAPGDAAQSRIEFALTVADGELVSGPGVMQVAQGTEVTIRIRSDRADELHLHGYDLHRRIAAGEPAELSFTADRSGRFELELHGSHVDVGALEVRPE